MEKITNVSWAYRLIDSYSTKNVFLYVHPEGDLEVTSHRDILLSLETSSFKINGLGAVAVEYHIHPIWALVQVSAASLSIKLPVDGLGKQ